jgi:hypothetical protein
MESKDFEAKPGGGLWGRFLAGGVLLGRATREAK